MYDKREGIELRQRGNQGSRHPVMTRLRCAEAIQQHTAEYSGRGRCNDRMRQLEPGTARANQAGKEWVQAEKDGEMRSRACDGGDEGVRGDLSSDVHRRQCSCDRASLEVAQSQQQSQPYHTGPRDAVMVVIARREVRG